MKKKKMKKEINKLSYSRGDYFLIGLFFLFIQVIVVFRNYLTSYLYFFWFCDFVPMLFALAFFLKKEQVVKAIINFGLLVQLYFLIFLITGQLSPELTFSPFLNVIYLATSILVHLSVIFALILTYKIKPKLQTIYFSIPLIIVIYFVTLIFTPSNDNINIINSSTGLIKLDSPYFTFLWPVLAFILLVLPTQGIQYLLYKFSIKKVDKK